MEDLNIDTDQLCRELDLEFLNRLCDKYQDDCLHVARGLALRHYQKRYMCLDPDQRKRVWLLAQDIVADHYREQQRSRSYPN